MGNDLRRVLKVTSGAYTAGVLGGESMKENPAYIGLKIRLKSSAYLVEQVI